MIKIKGFLSILLILALTTATCTLASAEKAEAEFKIFDIIGLDFDLSTSDKTLTRIELAELAISLGRSSLIYDTEPRYIDIPQRHWAYNIANTTYFYGYLDSYPDGRFAPEDNATVQDGTRVALALLGYNEFGKAAGWTTTDYLMKARSLGLSRGIPGIGGELTGKILAQIIVNMLSAPVAYVKAIRTNGTEYATDDETDYLRYKYHLYNIKGVVQAVGKSAILGYEPVNSSFIKINGVIYNSNGVDYSKHLGYTVKAVTDSDEHGGRVLHMERLESSAGESLTVKAQDIIEYKNLKLTYSDSFGNVKTVAASPSSGIILNGQTVSYDERLLQPLSGSVKLVDTDFDGVYDMIYITSVLYYKISGAYHNEYISDAFTKSRLELEGKNFSAVQNGEAVSFSAISVGMVAAVMPGAISYDANDFPIADNGALHRVSVEIGVPSASGKITAAGEDDCWIDGIEYEYSYYFLKMLEAGYAKKPEMGSIVIAYFDYDGNIAAMEYAGKAEDSERDFKYAYMSKFGANKGLSSLISLRVFTEDGEFKTLTCKNTLRVNGVKMNYSQIKEDARFFVGDVFQRQLIIYRLDENGEIAELETAVNYAESALTDKYGNSYDNENYGVVGGAGYDLSCFSYDYYANTTYRSNFNHLYTISDDSIVFEIPKDYEKEEKYIVLKGASAFVSGSAYKAQLYDAGEDYSVKAAVLDNSKAVSGGNKNLSYNIFVSVCGFMVSGITETLDEDGETKLIIRGLTYDAPNGKMTDLYSKTLMAADDELEDSDKNVTRITSGYEGTKWNELEPGDVIHYQLDSEGMVERFRTVFRISDFAASSGEPNFRTNTNSAWATVFTACGTVEKFFADGNFLFNASKEKLPTKLFKARRTGESAKAVKVFLFYKDRGLALPGTISDLRVGDGAYFRSESGNLLEVIVYR